MRVVIIGLGSIARKHVKVLRDLYPSVAIYALRSSRGGDRVEEVTDIFEFSLIEQLDPDFILLSNPTLLRRKALERVLPLNVPLFIEKPVLADLAGAEALANEIETRSLLTFVGCNLRFLPALQFVKNRLGEGGRRLNEVNVYCGSYLPNWRPGKDYRQMYSSHRMMGGGVHLDVIHELDYVYWMFGKPEHVNRTVRSVSHLGISAYDYANYVLAYPTFSAAVVLNYYRRDYKRTFELVFSDGSWMVDLSRNTIVDEGGELVFSGAGTISETYAAQMSEFIQQVNGKSHTTNSFSEGVEVLKIALNEL